MKLIYCVLLTLIIGFTQAKNADSTNANKNYQFGKNELFTSYGFLSISTFGLVFGRVFSSDYPSSYFFSDKDEYRTTYRAVPPGIGALNFGYKRFVFKDKLCVTANFSYSQLNQNNTSIINDSLSFKTRDKVFCIMPGIEYHYLNRKLVQLYAGAQVGLLIYSQKYIGSNNEIKKHNELFVAFQVDAFGIRVGSKIEGFAEIGFGNAGIVKLGISGRF